MVIQALIDSPGYTRVPDAEIGRLAGTKAARWIGLAVVLRAWRDAGDAGALGWLELTNEAHIQAAARIFGCDRTTITRGIQALKAEGALVGQRGHKEEGWALLAFMYEPGTAGEIELARVRKQFDRAERQRARVQRQRADLHRHRADLHGETLFSGRSGQITDPPPPTSLEGSARPVSESAAGAASSDPRARNHPTAEGLDGGASPAAPGAATSSPPDPRRIRPAERGAATIGWLRDRNRTPETA